MRQSGGSCLFLTRLHRGSRRPQEHLPATVDLKVVDTVPGIKGATANAQTKPATLETGYVVTVPAFVEVGTMVRINTESGEYLSRV